MAGLDLAITGRNVAALGEVAREIREFGATVWPFEADLADPLAVEQLAAAVEETLGAVEVLVNNAGVEIASSFTRYSPDELDGIVALDLLVPLRLTRRLLPGMLGRGYGHVVNVCSLASKGPLPYGVPYAAAKWGLAGATASLRVEYEGSGVGFSAVIPGFVTGAGIFARHQADGVSAPPLFGTTTPERVGRAVVTAIRRNAAEIIVTAHPIRPFLALAALAPAMSPRLTAWTGVTAVARRAARLDQRLDDAGTSAAGGGDTRA
jgi:short-subunit dehydrogenase